MEESRGSKRVNELLEKALEGEAASFDSHRDYVAALEAEVIKLIDQREETNRYLYARGVEMAEMVQRLERAEELAKSWEKVARMNSPSSSDGQKRREEGGPNPRRAE